MQIGIALPHIGPSAGVEAILAVARKAEALGLDSLWTLDRLLWPLYPASKYPGNPQGKLPAAMQNTYDPLTVLTFVAAQTKKIRLGTSVLVAPYRSPVILAKIGATLDLLSGGRLILGVGAGWSSDEFDAVNLKLSERNERTDECIKALRVLWTDEEPCFEGKYYRIPRSIFLPKPLQAPHPPVWIGGNSRRVLRRAAELGDGWHPTSRLGPSAVAEEAKYLRELTQKAGRRPEDVVVSLRWNAFPDITKKSAACEVVDKMHAYHEAGVEHICIDLNIPECVAVGFMFETMDSLAKEVIPSI